MKNLLFTLCARAGSKGVRGKNVRPLLGLPLVSYTLAAISLYAEDKGFSPLIALNTDSDELVAQMGALGVPFVHVPRKEELAGDTASKIDVIRDSYLAVQRDHPAFDAVVDLDLTSPLRRDGDLGALVGAYFDGPPADVVFTVTSPRRNPYFNMVKAEGDYVTRVIESNFVARQQAPAVYDMNASLYAYRPAFLLQNKAIFDGRCRVSLMRDTAVLDIDSDEDYRLMELLGAHFFEHDPAMRRVADRAAALAGREGR